MKRSLLVLLALVTFSAAQAQSTYVGLYVSGIVSSSAITPFGGVQVGGPVAENVELRLSGFTILFASFAQLDLLYTQRFNETLRGYVGGGGGLYTAAFTEDAEAADLHATVGVEAGVGSGVGLFAEVQPTYVLNAPDESLALLLGNEGAATFFGTLSLGVNVHF